MANRTVSVALKMLIGDYLPNAEKAAGATDKIGSAATKAGAQYRHGAQQIVLGAGAAGAAGALALGKIVGAAMGFDKAMSNVGAVSDATTGQLEQLRDAALKAGADTAFSASEAAQAEAELAKAGVSTSDILGGALRGSLDLAAAGQLDLANAATISANAMNIFGLKGSDVGMIADTLAAGANKSAADVDQLAQAMSQGGQVAASMGLDLQDTVGALSMFADAGLKGSDAGTSLKTALQRLAAPSSEAADLMKQLGLYAFDAQGNFVGLDNFAGQLQKRLGGLTQEQRNSALATIFGSDAVRVAGILYKQGAAGVRDYNAAVEDQGAAQRNAAKQLDNLAGDVEAFSGSVETVLIKSGSGANSMLRSITQGATGAVNAFGALPGPVQAAAVGLLAVGTGGAGAIAVLGTLVPRIQAGRAALQEMGRAGEMANTAIGKIGKGAAIGSGVLIGVELLTAGIRALQDQLVGAPKAVNELTSSLLKARDWTDISRTLGGKFEDLGIQIRKLTDHSTVEGFNRFFRSVTHLDPRSLREAKQDVGALDQALAQLVSSGHGDEASRQFELVAQAAIAGGASVDQVREALPAYRDALAAVANESELAGKGQEKVGSSAAGAKPPLSAMEQAARGLGVELKEGATEADLLKSALDRLNGASLGALDTDIAYRQSLTALGEALKENGRTLDINTTKGQANLSAVSDAIKRAEEHATAVANETGSVDKGTEVFRRHMEQLRKVAPAGSALRREIERLIDKYGQVPPKVETSVSAPGAARSKAQADAVTTAANKIPKTRMTQVSAPGATDAAGKMNRVTQLANGIPEVETTKVSAPGAETASGKMNAVTRAANNIPERETVSIGAVDRASGTIARVSRSLASLDGTTATTYVETIRIGTGAFAITGRASGGPVEAGQLYRVNESGAEGYFVPPADGYVINHRDFAAMLDGRSLRPAPTVAGAGRPPVTLSMPITVYPAPGMDEAALATRVADRVSARIGSEADLLFRAGAAA